MCFTWYLWGADQIYKGLFAADCSKNVWYHLTFSAKSICLRHCRKAYRAVIKSFIKAVTAHYVSGWTEIQWVDSISRGVQVCDWFASVCCPVYWNPTQDFPTIHYNLDCDLQTPLNSEFIKKSLSSKASRLYKLNSQSHFCPQQKSLVNQHLRFNWYLLTVPMYWKCGGMKVP